MIPDFLPETPAMPVLFVGHGSPMNAIEDNAFSRAWRGVARDLPRPAAILCISAHWETHGTRVTANLHPETIHDFGGFPGALYEATYPAPGSPALAAETARTVGSREVLPDAGWGLDHGCWSVLVHMFPDAEIPVVQLSLDRATPGPGHLALAAELSPLRRRGVLLVGSGNMVHNLRMAHAPEGDFNQPFAYDWALEADATFKRLIAGRDHAALADYPALGRAVRLAVPTPEHYLPVLYALALRGEDEELHYFNDVPIAGSLTMTGFRIG
jgi:4,5-DOPA dioxygenase extradiol